MDAAHESLDGHIGMTLKEDIEKKLDKLTVVKYILNLFYSLKIINNNSSYLKSIGTTSS